jgi:glycosyltransferase involved in cell wall biosynthesis
MMKIQLLISTINNTFECIKSKFFNFNYFVINQVNSNCFLYTNDFFKSYNELGLSKSRNRLLENATGDICLICDDDIEIVNNCISTITKAYDIYPDADIITFQIVTPENYLYKKYKKKPFRHNIYSILNVSSIEITFKLNSIINSNIKFDERFGLGSIYSGGEENIFLKDAIDSGLKIYYYPYPITIHKFHSSNKNFNNNYFYTKGAILKRLYGTKGIVISFLFLLRQIQKVNQFSNIYNYINSFWNGWSSIKV